MNRSNILSRAWEKTGQAKPAPLFWRAEEDRPLSLGAPMRGETASSQRALVLAFAALAAAGAAYLATALVAHHAPNLMTSAEAETAFTAQTIAADSVASKAPVPAAPMAAAAPKSQPALANPLQPEPVKVTTIKVPAKPKAVPQAEPVTPPSEDLPGSADLRWARLTGNSQPPHASEIATAAYASDPAPEVTAGVDAIKREVVEVAAPAKPVVVASIEGAVQDSGRSARVRTAVNMRSQPADGSTVISVIPGNATVSVAPGCRHWCKVSFKGRSGFIYKGFLR